MREEDRWNEADLVEIRTSEVESQASGVKVGRIPQETADLATNDCIRNTILRSPHDLVVLRHSSDRIGLSSALNRDGLRCVQADTLLYFGIEPRVDQRTSRNAVLSDARGLTCDVLGSLTTRIFEGYRNHYTASPELASISVESAYQDWVLRSREDSNCRLWVLSVLGMGQCALAITERNRTAARRSFLQVSFQRQDDEESTRNYSRGLWAKKREVGFLLFAYPLNLATSASCVPG